jgi:hypothetical protein
LTISSRCVQVAVMQRTVANTYSRKR